MTSPLPPRLSLKTLGALALLALPLTACVTDSQNRSVDSVHQPVVSYAAYTYDVQAGVGDTLTPAESRRLDDWFTSIALSYGDQVAIVSDGYYGPALHDASPISPRAVDCWSVATVRPPQASRRRA